MSDTNSTSQRDDIAQPLSKFRIEGQKYVSSKPGSQENLIAIACDLVDVVETQIESLLWLFWADVNITAVLNVQL